MDDREQSCSVEGCERAARRRRDLCHAHAKKRWKYGDPLAGGNWCRWTPEEDAQVRAIIPPGGTRVAAGVAADLALMLERSPPAVYSRAFRLRRRQWESEKAAALA